ncbi:hypothetical protein HFO93_22440 [Rhizobium leguminosarum]|uniref:hypothetical protein n=1 Tax=Rhizobium leguminosarum TaxID=384 RepID=UPI001C953E56|nr:hypothetical protein [Rhizobium leguminosarum]MBY5446192.1 hypothetical protein [Rhizobium leguminosarum]
MAFIVNGAEWNFNGLSPMQAKEKIDRALEFIAISSDRGEEVSVGDDFQTRPMHGDAMLWDLFENGSALSLPRELAHELAAWLMRAPRYANAERWPPGFGDCDISIGGAPAEANPDVESAHFASRDGSPTACLTIGHARIVETTMATGSADIHFVCDESSRKAFWREVIILSGDTLATLSHYASNAYPQLHFVDGVLNDAGSLVGGYLASRQRVQRILATLNDWGHWTFTCPPPALAPGEMLLQNMDEHPSNQLIKRRFVGFYLDAAPEKPNVRLNRKCREAREIKLGERTLYCEWHVKLEGHQNRIHFHAPVPESDDKLVIGIIHEHLPLP